MKRYVLSVRYWKRPRRWCKVIVDVVWNRSTSLNVNYWVNAGRHPTVNQPSDSTLTRSMNINEQWWAGHHSVNDLLWIFTRGVTRLSVSYQTVHWLSQWILMSTGGRSITQSLWIFMNGCHPTVSQPWNRTFTQSMNINEQQWRGITQSMTQCEYSWVDVTPSVSQPWDSTSTLSMTHCEYWWAVVGVSQLSHDKYSWASILINWLRSESYCFITLAQNFP